MPHTRDGQLVNVGDVLYLPCKVKSVQTGEEFCNVDVETVYPMPPYDKPSNFSAVNTKQFVSTGALVVDGEGKVQSVIPG